MNIFIDTNIYLSFYEFTNDDLDELRKLTELLANGNVRLFLPDQVKQEFNRRCENIIDEAMKGLKNQKLKSQIPIFCKDYPEYKKLKKLEQEYQELHKKLVEQSTQDINNNNLKADQVIKALFSRAEVIISGVHLISRARFRMELGNPPGKKGSLGDAINWEVLLNKATVGKDIYFITGDTDYVSPLNKNKFNRFLLDEWKEVKKSELFFYKNLTSFFTDHFPDITLKNEPEINVAKEALIALLGISLSSSEFRAVISRLNDISDFTVNEVNDIIAAFVENAQLYEVIKEYDVKRFLWRIIKGKEEQLNQVYLYRLEQILPFGGSPEILTS